MPSTEKASPREQNARSVNGSQRVTNDASRAVKFTRKRPTIHVIDYDAAHVEEKRITDFTECLTYRDSKSVTWINVEGLDKKLTLEIGRHFNLHELLVEDIVTVNQRPKVEDYKDTILIIFKMFSFDEAKGKLASEHVSLLVAQHYVISFQQGMQGDIFDPIRARIKEGAGSLRTRGNDFLAYALLNMVVDHYFVILEALGNKLERLQTEFVTQQQQRVIGALVHLKKDLALLRFSVWPLREAIATLNRGETPLIKPQTRIYFRDLYEHIIHVIETMESYRDVLSGVFEMHLSSVSVRTNEIVKTLTVITTFFIPLTFVTGIYGMNFESMPFLHEPWGYSATLLGMGVIALMMYFFFRRKKWL